jgi:DnaJ like chaperone protein
MYLRHFFAHQTWWGKLLGAFLGFLMAGPAGAFFGILIGNFFDRGLNEHFSNPYWHFQAEKRSDVKTIFIEALFSIMGHISKADGRVSEQEIQMAKTLMDDLNLNKSQKKIAQYFFNEGKKPNFNLKQTLTTLQNKSAHNPELLKLFIDIQYRIAQLDGLSQSKIKIMNIILTYLRFAPMHEQSRFQEDIFRESTQQRSYQSHQSTYQSKPEDTLARAYSILQIEPTATKQAVKYAYRQLISRNHPDKLIAQGASKEKINLATEKTQIIRKAYEQICANKGW